MTKHECRMTKEDKARHFCHVERSETSQAIILPWRDQQWRSEILRFAQNDSLEIVSSFDHSSLFRASSFVIRHLFSVGFISRTRHRVCRKTCYYRQGPLGFRFD